MLPQLRLECNNINDVLSSAMLLAQKKPWSLKAALHVCQTMATHNKLKCEYDDGPPENWVELLSSQGHRIGLVGILAPSFFVLKSEFSDAFFDGLEEVNLAWMKIDSWEEETHIIDGEILSKFVGWDCTNYTEYKEGIPISFDDFWFHTVT